MRINSREYSEPELQAYINERNAVIERLDGQNYELEEKLNKLGADFNAMVSTVDFMEEQVSNYKTQMLKLDEENQSLKSLLREIQPVLHIAFFANFKDSTKANELYDQITKIVGKE